MEGNNELREERSGILAVVESLAYSASALQKRRKKKPFGAFSLFIIVVAL